MKSIKKRIYRYLLRLIPESNFGDHFLSFVTFFRLHRRLPGSRLLFNDVLYQLKNSDELIDPLRIFVSDKEFVKLFVKAVVGDQFNVPTIKILHTFEEVKAYSFPADCCIKPTHLSGEVILRRDSKPIDLEKIESWFKKSYYKATREINYKTLRPKVIVEPLIFNSDNVSDYKIFCYLGEPKLIQVNMDRHTEHTEKLLDTEWTDLPFSIHYPRSQLPIARPKNLDQMLEVSRLLSKYFSLIRIDLYSNGDECLLGEITNCPGGATAFVSSLYGKEIQAGATSPYSRANGGVTQSEEIASNIIFGKN